MPQLAMFPDAGLQGPIGVHQAAFTTELAVHEPAGIPAAIGVQKAALAFKLAVRPSANIFIAIGVAHGALAAGNAMIPVASESGAIAKYHGALAGGLAVPPAARVFAAVSEGHGAFAVGGVVLPRPGVRVAIRIVKEGDARIQCAAQQLVQRCRLQRVNAHAAQRDLRNRQHPWPDIYSAHMLPVSLLAGSRPRRARTNAPACHVPRCRSPWSHRRAPGCLHH